MAEPVSEKDPSLKDHPPAEPPSKITEWNGREIREVKRQSNPLFNDALQNDLQEVVENSRKALDSPAAKEGRQLALKQMEDLSQFLGSQGSEEALINPRKKENGSSLISVNPLSSPNAILTIDSDAPPRIYVNSAETPLSFIPRIFEIPGKKVTHGQIGGINGIGNTLGIALQNAFYIGQLSGHHHIEWTFNRTNSTPIDILEATIFNFKGISGPAKDLKSNWVKFHEEHINNSNAKYFQLCHSQGAIHVRNALQNAPQEIRDRVIVFSIAPAAVVPKGLCFDSYNYASKRDPTPYFEAAFNYDGDASYEERMSEPTREALKELIILEPHPDAPIVDHFLDSPTFKQIIQQRIEEFINKYGESQ